MPYKSGASIETVENKGSGVAFFRGGFKTEAGRNRIVPIHSAILPLVREITVRGTDKTGATNTEGATETTATIGATDAEDARDTTYAVVAADADADSCPDCLTGKVRFLCGKGHSQYRRDMKEILLQIGVDGVMEGGVLRHHTPHSCRHTFSRLCESYGVNEADRKRLMGHSFGNDITNGVYGHRSVEELQAEIEKIRLTF